MAGRWSHPFLPSIPLLPSPLFLCFGRCCRRDFLCFEHQIQGAPWCSPPAAAAATQGAGAGGATATAAAALRPAFPGSPPAPSSLLCGLTPQQEPPAFHARPGLRGPRRVPEPSASVAPCWRVELHLPCWLLP